MSEEVSRLTPPRESFVFEHGEAMDHAFVSAYDHNRLHHAWLGGLLEHALTLVRVCVATALFYPEVDPDLLVTGAILHDIGKIRELSWKSSFNYTLEGQMVGHISIAQGMLREKVQALAPFPEKLRILVEHMILSHHGKYEFGSPKLPMFPEALLLHQLDDMDSKMQAMITQLRSEAPGAVRDWTSYNRSLERPLLRREEYWPGGGTADAQQAGKP